MSMFFNFRGAGWVLLVILLVAFVCLLDLKCSFMRDERDRVDAAQPPPSGALARVKGEMSAGKEAWNQMREEQLNEQLRTFRVMAKRFAETGQHKRAQALVSLIQEIEREKKRRAQN